MFGQVVGMLSDVLTNIGFWFLMVFENAGMTTYYLAAMFILLLGRYIIYPLVGATVRSGASDTVKRNKGGKKNG